jgi:ribulose-5-phosphate 4-epimerase/fuculose-1-phosphate aldolase
MEVRIMTDTSDLIDALHMLEAQGIIDFNGHASLRAGPTSFAINSGRSVRCALRPGDIVTVDLDGRLVEGYDAPPQEYHIHSEIYRRRNDVGAIVHAHPKWSTFLTMASREIEPVFPQGALLGDLKVFDSPLSVSTREMGGRVADTLADDRAALLRSHGTIVVGADIKEAFCLTVYLEENAYRQYMALALGQPYAFSTEEITSCRSSLWKPHLFQKAWDYYRAKLGG